MRRGACESCRAATAGRSKGYLIKEQLREAQGQRQGRQDPAARHDRLGAPPPYPRVREARQDPSAGSGSSSTPPSAATECFVIAECNEIGNQPGYSCCHRMQCRSGGSTSTPGGEIGGEAGISSPDEASACASPESGMIGLENRNPEIFLAFPWNMMLVARMMRSPLT
jgi:hypothetical protein